MQSRTSTGTQWSALSTMVVWAGKIKQKEQPLSLSPILSSPPLPMTSILSAHLSLSSTFSFFQLSLYRHFYLFLALPSIYIRFPFIHPSLAILPFRFHFCLFVPFHPRHCLCHTFSLPEFIHAIAPFSLVFLLIFSHLCLSFYNSVCLHPF